MGANFDVDEAGAIIALPLMMAAAAEIPGYELLVLRLEFVSEGNERVALQLRLQRDAARDLGQMLVSLANANLPASKN